MTDKPIIIDGIKFTENFDIICQTCTRNNPCFQQCNQVYKEIIKYLFNNLQRKTAELDKIEEVIAPYQEPLEADAFSLSGAIKSILQRKTAECEKLEKINKANLKAGKDLNKEITLLQHKTAEHERLCRDYFKQNEWLQQRAKECEQLQHKLQIATEALRSILDEADVLNEFISKEGYLCGFVNIAQKALEQIGEKE